MSEQITLRCKAVLFDMDGTLVDSTRVVESNWSQWSARRGLQAKDVLSYSHGRPTISTLEYFFPGRDHTQDLAELDSYEEAEFEGTVAVPGALEAVQSLQGHPWAVVTSAWRSLAESRITGVGLPLPEVMVPVDEIRIGKPHPEGFLKAASILKVAPQDCIVFEDTRPGIDAGLAAGMQVVGILTTLQAAQLRHPILIADFHDVVIRPDADGLSVQITNRA